MNPSATSWLIILLALVFANLPFFNERFFALIALKRVPSKPFWLRLIELAVLYFVLGAFTFVLEALAGNRYTQTWEFYAITVSLFIVMAFPGFVYRYLGK